MINIAFNRSFVTFFVLFWCLLAFNFSVLSETIYVDCNNGSIFQDGSCWELAFNNLDSALTKAESGDDIWIATGIYFPGSDRTATFTIQGGISLYGGFKGHEKVLSERNFVESPTILSGDIGIVGDSSDNCTNVLLISDPFPKIILDGLVIENGTSFTDNSYPSDSRWRSGSGLFVTGEISDSSELFIRNCTFKNNHSNSFGGAIYYQNESSNQLKLVISFSSFIYNSCEAFGGALHIAGEGVLADSLLNSCSFESNFAELGGAIYVKKISNSTISVSRSTFARNLAESGSAIGIDFPGDSCEIGVTQCTFANNFSHQYGGSFSLKGGFSQSLDKDILLVFDSCSFTNEKSIVFGDTSSGSALYYYGRDTVNTIISNSKFFSSGITGNSTPGKFTIFNSTIQDCSSSYVLRLTFDTVHIINTNIFNNHSEQPMLIGGDCVEFLNSNISNNHVISSGWLLTSTNELILTNSILWDNSINPDVNLIAKRFTAINSITDLADFHSVRMLNEFGQPISPLQFETISCIFSADPLFRNPTLGNYELLSCSPAINTGLNNPLIVNDIYTDSYGNFRIIDSIVDIGPYEHPYPFYFDTISVDDISCHGRSDGSVLVDANGMYPLDLFWISNQTSGSHIDNLGPGSYLLILRDSDNCADTIPIDIIEPDRLESTIITENIACFGDSTGVIEVNTTGGRPPYEFIWSSGFLTSSIINAPAGTYVVTTTDISGCTHLAEAIIEENTRIVANIGTTAPTTQFSQDGSITIESVHGGIPPFSILWPDGSDGLALHNISAGIYDIHITDSKGCDEVIIVELIPEYSLNSPIKIGLWPNPINRNHDLTINILSSSEFILTISVFDVLGRRTPALLESRPIITGINSLKYNLDLPYGTYFLQMKSGSTTISINKLVVISD